MNEALLQHVFRNIAPMAFDEAFIGHPSDLGYETTEETTARNISPDPSAKLILAAFALTCLDFLSQS
jgi:hypothetical protein